MDWFGIEVGKIGYFVFIKVVVGGGGKGMCKVDVVVDFCDVLELCCCEVKGFFGDDCVLIEKYVECLWYIEV